MGVLATVTEWAFAIAFALVAIGLCLLLAVCVGSMLYALYKGATDETWR